MSIKSKERKTKKIPSAGNQTVIETKKNLVSLTHNNVEQPTPRADVQ
jgi:hypothetical protein